MANNNKIQVGGQAVIEGVTMRGPNYLATAVRRANGAIELKREEFISITKRNRLAALPVVRGFVSLIEMLKIGIGTLTFSAQRFELDLDEPGAQKSGAWQKFQEYFSLILAFALAFGLFGVLPYKSAEWLNFKGSVWFNVFAGAIRVVFFVVYLLIIGRFKDVRRLFCYHGAEHKAVFCHEQKLELNVENASKFTTRHPRCGTSFMFFVLLVSILVFSTADTLVTMFLPEHLPYIFDTSGPIIKLIVWYRLAYHLLLLPLVSGLSYEVLRLSGRMPNHPLVKFLTIPGLNLQRITTTEPDDQMLEVALVSLKAAMEMPLDDQNLIWLEDEKKEYDTTGKD